jgi:hypothetical protein
MALFLRKKNYFVHKNLYTLVRTFTLISILNVFLSDAHIFKESIEFVSDVTEIDKIL